jgi:DNA-binding Lrp family transcriptional regulator
MPVPYRRKSMTTLDKRILNRLQEDIPFTENPWEKIAVELNISENSLLKRMAYFKKKGIIRRISAVFAPRKVNFVSTLVGVKAAPGKIKETAQKINSYPEVTHNYKRNAEYNLWCALVAKDKKRIAQILRSLRKDKNIRELTEFPMVKLFKINVKFEV